MDNLIGSMLAKDPNHRPTINQILKHPVVFEQISKVLAEDIKEAEFGHTILHGINPFGNMTASQVQQEEEKFEAQIVQRKKSLKEDCQNEAHRDDHDEGECDTTTESKPLKDQEDINLVGCEYPKFEKKMIERYGES